MISKELLKTLEEFLKDHENSSTNGKLRSPPKLSLPAPRRQNSDVRDQFPFTPKPADRRSICSTTDWELLNSNQEWPSEGQARASFAGSKNSIGGTLFDLLSFDDELRSSAAASNSDRENGVIRDLVPFDNQPKQSTASNSAQENGAVSDPVTFDNQSKASTSSSSDRENGVALDLVPFDNQSKASTSPNLDPWELVLVESANKMSNTTSTNSIKGAKNLKLDSPLDHAGSFHQFPLNYYNPFLHDFDDKNLAMVPSPWSSLPSPTFRAAGPNEESAKEGADPFAWSSPSLTRTLDMSAVQQQQQQQLLTEQQSWMQYQRKIIAKNV